MENITKTKIRMVQAASSNITMSTFGRGQMAFFRRHGFDVDYLCVNDELLEPILQEGVNFFNVDFRRALSPLADIKALVCLYRLFSCRKPSVILLKTLKPGILGAVAGRLAGVPLIIRYKQGYMRDCNYKGLKRKLLFMADRLAYKYAHRVVAVSHGLRRAEIAAGIIEPDKIVVYGQGTSHGINLDRYAPTPELKHKGIRIRHQLGIDDGYRVIGTAMRVNVEKGICELVDSFTTITEKHSNICLMIVGDYDIRNRPPKNIVQIIAEHPKIHLVGWQNNIEEYYSAMDIFVLPTYREGFCNTNIEASAMELPVISTDIIGVNGSSVLDGITGLIVPVRDSKALSRAIETLLASPTMAEELGRNGRLRVEKEFPNQLVWHLQLKDMCLLLRERGIDPPVEPDMITEAGCSLCSV